MPRAEVSIMLIVLILSSVWNLVYAVGIGLVIASLMFMKKIGDLTAEKSSVVPLKEVPWKDEKNIPKNVFIKHVEGPLFFGSTSDFQQLAKQIPNDSGVIIIRLEKMPYMDQSGLYAMEDVLVDLVSSGKKVLLVGLVEQPKYMLERIDIIPNLIPQDQVFEKLDESIFWVKDHYN